MKVKIRRSSNDDLDKIFDLHLKCFDTTDCWYKSAITNYLDSGIVISNEKEIIGVLLQGMIMPCNKKFADSNEDIFEPVNDVGNIFLQNNDHMREHNGIVMICIHPDYRGKGLAKKLIEKHFQDNKTKLVCLNTRRSNISAYKLYKSMNYIHIGFIKNKYFLPNEDSIFMIKA